jgi:hypothetical protein
LCIEEGLAGEQSALAAVLPTIFENFPDQPNPSAAGEKIRPHIKFTHRGQYVLQQNFGPLATLPTRQYCRLLTGEKGCHKEQNRRRLEQNKSAKTLGFPASSSSICGVHYEMRCRQNLHM